MYEPSPCYQHYLLKHPYNNFTYHHKALQIHFIKVRVSLYPQLTLQHIHIPLFNKTQTIKYIQIYTIPIFWIGGLCPVFGNRENSRRGYTGFLHQIMEPRWGVGDNVDGGSAGSSGEVGGGHPK